MGAMEAIGVMRTGRSDCGKSEECEGKGSGEMLVNGGARIPGPECKTE